MIMFIGLQGVSLFGYDVVIDANNLSYNVVDVNYFPGFRGSPDAYKSLARYLSTKCGY